MKTILFIDTETTGLPNFKLARTAASQPRIVQLGAMLATGEGETLAEFSTLITPDDWTISPEAEAVHGISADKCNLFGVDAHTALNVVRLLARKADVLVAHNFDFDRFILDGEMLRHFNHEFVAMEQEPFCTMRAMTNVMKMPGTRGPGYKWPKLAEAYKFLFETELEGAHDAMADVRACAKIYFEFVRRTSASA